MNCEQCGVAVPAKAKFCGRCGSAMNIRTAPAQRHAGTRGWSPAEESALAEARTKLDRQRRHYAGLFIVGVLVTVGTIALGAGAFIVAYGPMIAGPLYFYQADRRRKRLEHLQPGTPLNAKVLGVRTRIDPPRPSQRKGIIIVGAMIGIVILAVVLMVVTNK